MKPSHDRFEVAQVTRRSARSVVLALALGLIGGQLRADATWLRPESHRATVGAGLTLQILYGSAFGDNGQGLAPDKIRTWRGVVGDLPLSFVPSGANTRPWKVMAFFLQPGVAVVATDLTPNLRTVPRGDVEQYLRELHATDQLRAEWSHIPSSEPWREIAMARLKTFVRIGQPRLDDRGWERPSGDLDLLPEDDPTTLKQGDRIRVHMMLKQQPVPGVVVSFVSYGEGREHVAFTDDSGRASAALDAAGEWLVRATVVQRVNAADHDWETFSVSLSVEVR